LAHEAAAEPSDAAPAPRRCHCPAAASPALPARHAAQGRRAGTPARRARGRARGRGKRTATATSATGRAQTVCFCPALDGALNFRKRAEKRRRLSERSEFASFSARLRKFKEGVAISGAPFFAYFLWQDKESESAPAGDETAADHQHQTQNQNPACCTAHSKTTPPSPIPGSPTPRRTIRASVPTQLTPDTALRITEGDRPAEVDNPSNVMETIECHRLPCSARRAGSCARV